MAVYRVADVNMAYEPKSAYAREFLLAYAAQGEAAVTLCVTTADIAAEATFLPTFHDGVREVAALLRKTASVMCGYDRLLLHAATVVFDGKAYAFAAPSGTGKTTHARLWETVFPDRARILNGDKLFVHIGEDGVTAYGNPWRGKEHLGFNGSAPLGGLFLLDRSEIASCEMIAPADALPQMLRAVPFPQQAQERLATLALLERLCMAVPICRLHAPLSEQAVEAVINTVGGTA